MNGDSPPTKPEQGPPEMHLLELRGADDQSELWRELVASVGQECPLLQYEPLYCLPKELLMNLGKAIPGLLRRNGKAEKELAHMCQAYSLAGFWRRRPVSSVLAYRLDPCFQNEDGWAQYAELRHELEGRDLLIQEEVAGLIAGQVAGRMMQSYLGWLTTEPTYRRELDLLRQQGESIIDKVRQAAVTINWIPLIEDVRQAGLPVAEEDKPFFEQYNTFCRRWCLDHLVTWDLPQPVNPVWDMPFDRVSEQLSDQGILMFIPFSLIPHNKVDLSAMYKGLQGRRTPTHLKGWVARRSAGRLKQGQERFAEIFLFQHYLGVIDGRYEGQLKGRKQKVRAAVAAYVAGIKDLDVEQNMSLAQKLFHQLKTRLELEKGSGSGAPLPQPM